MKKLFTGDDCPNCAVAKQYIADNNLDIEIVHIDPTNRAWRDLQMQYRVMGVPTLITFQDNQEVDRQVGVIDFTKI